MSKVNNNVLEVKDIVKERVEIMVVGQKFKNYKELCEFLRQPVKTGNAKISQLQDFSRYFEYDKKRNNSFEVIKIHEAVLPPVVNEGNTIYRNNVEKLVLDFMALEYEKGNAKIHLPVNNILTTLNMMTKDFTLLRDNPTIFKNLLGIPKKKTTKFYSDNRLNLRKVLTGALNKLQSKSLILWRQDFMVVVDKSKESINYEYINENQRVAEDYEKEYLLSVRHDVLERLEFDNLYEVYKNDRMFDKIKYIENEDGTTTEEIELVGFFSEVERRLLGCENVDFQHINGFYDIITLYFHEAVIRKSKQLEYVLNIDERTNVKINLNTDLVKGKEKSIVKTGEKSKAKKTKLHNDKKTFGTVQDVDLNPINKSVEQDIILADITINADENSGSIDKLQRGEIDLDTITDKAKGIIEAIEKEQSKAKISRKKRVKKSTKK